MGSDRRDLPEGKQRCQFDRSLAFSELIRHRVSNIKSDGNTGIHLIFTTKYGNPFKVIHLNQFKETLYLMTFLLRDS